MKPWAVMCCGCSKGLGLNGENVGNGDGLLPRADLAAFDTKEEADEAAVKAGWQVADKLGPNHRCAECKTKKGSQRRGAYIRLMDLPL